MKIGPLDHTGSNFNLAFYAERGQLAGHVRAEVIRNDRKRTSGGILIPRRIPAFSVTVHKHGAGEIGRFTYEPKTKPAPGPLPARTVTRLVREHLAGEARS